MQAAAAAKRPEALYKRAPHGQNGKKIREEAGMDTPEDRHGRAGPIHASGWTLSELLVSLALMATLASLALPAYLQQQRQARRSDALVALQQLQMDQARWRDAHETYADSLSALGWRTERSPGGHYAIRIAHADAEGYTLEAWPTGSQAADQACSPLRLTGHGNASPIFSAGEHTDSDPLRCWRQ